MNVCPSPGDPKYQKYEGSLGSASCACAELMMVSVVRRRMVVRMLLAVSIALLDGMPIVCIALLGI